MNRRHWSLGPSPLLSQSTSSSSLIDEAVVHRHCSPIAAIHEEEDGDLFLLQCYIEWRVRTGFGWAGLLGRNKSQNGWSQELKSSRGGRIAKNDWNQERKATTMEEDIDAAKKQKQR
ncbi:hypothetical protein PIB30_045286 [Stylosanthes scabra]|uniref:Uncharacterized protein n=1 Tax=Stylosanthes scabra TaxID=79078 RepID=A0ABU6TGE8_9FABA|nr:hypothetical protein [Stylosanthes scabra]